MGILSTQLIGSGNLENAARDPFPQPPEREVPSLGFGGFRYAKDIEQRELFNVAATREGPNELISNDPVYGGENGARPSTDGTVLGQMAQMLQPRKEGDTDPAWNTEGAGARMGHTFTSSGARRSFKDRTVTGTVPNASGGYSGGFDANNTYGITNWLAEGGTGIEAKAAVEEVSVPWLDPATGQRNKLTEQGFGRHKGNWTANENKGDFILVEAAAAVATSQQAESFRSGGSSTGLRNMPVSPTS